MPVAPLSHRRWARQLLTLQSTVAALLWGIGLAGFSRTTATSLGLGGLACVLPNAIFALCLFQQAGAQNAPKMLRNAFKGEALKLLTSALIFYFIFRFYPVTPIPLFLGLITVQSTLIWGPPLLNRLGSAQ